MIAVYIIFGALSGVIGAMGMGGGTILIPLLTIFGGVDQIMAQSINLLAFLPMSIIAIIVNFKNNFIDLKYILFIVVSGVVFSVLGSVVAHFVSISVLTNLFGGFLILLSIFQFCKIIKK